MKQLVGFCVVLDEEGKQFDSAEWAEMLADISDRSFSVVTFCIGGAFGFSNDVHSRAHLVLSLSRMTICHAVARAVCLEQVLRAWTILRGEPYHH